MSKDTEQQRRHGDYIVAEDVVARKVEWLWRERIPKGMISVVAGRPDQGKGLFAAHVAAQVSKQGGNVLYSAVEDDHGLMTRPRLEAAGADLAKIMLWRFVLPEQADELAAHVIEKKIDLVIMDPFTAHLGGGVSRHSDSIRKVTTPMSELAEATGCSFVVIEHALKRVARNAHPLAAIGGSSSGLPAASRMAFVFGVDPEDSDRRLLCTVKSNLREKPMALSFETDSAEVGLAGEMPLLVYRDETVYDARRLLGDEDAGEVAKVGRRPDKREAAEEWLTQYLVAAGKPVKGSIVQEDARAHGLTNRTVRRAADDMGVVRSSMGGRNVTWDLPPEVKKEQGVQARRPMTLEQMLAEENRKGGK